MSSARDDHCIQLKHASQWHPDKNDSPEAKKKFEDIANGK